MLELQCPDPTPSTKLNKLVEILQAIFKAEEGLEKHEKRKILVYSAWPSLWPMIQAHLKSRGIPAMTISEAAGPKRDAQIAEFQQDGPHIVDGTESYVAFISSAVGTGLNLTRSSTIIKLVGLATIRDCSL